MKSYVWPDSYDTLEGYGSSSNIGYGTSSVIGYDTNFLDSGSNAGYANTHNQNSGVFAAANPDSLAPAYGLPGSPGLYSLSGQADTYVLHGQADINQHKQADNFLDGWPAVHQPDNHLTQGGRDSGCTLIHWLHSETAVAL